MNGGGRIEREYGLGRGRTDLLIIWPQPSREDPHAARRFVTECKVLRKSLEQTIREGLEQTAGYMDRCAAHAGHLVVFDRTELKRSEDRMFRPEERADDGHTITVWGNVARMPNSRRPTVSLPSPTHSNATDVHAPASGRSYRRVCFTTPTSDYRTQPRPLSHTVLRRYWDDPVAYPAPLLIEARSTQVELFTRCTR